MLKLCASKLFSVLLVTLSFLWLAPLPRVQAAGDFDSLSAAIRAANSGTVSSTITLSADITLNDAALPPITGEVTIEGAGHTINGRWRYRIFDVNGGALNISNVTLYRGKPADSSDGGAIRLRNGAQVQATDVTFQDNRAHRGGAIAIFNAGDRLTVSGSRFLRNESHHDAGAIFAEGGRIKITQSSFEDNKARYYGGAISAYGGETVVSNTTFDRNYSEGGGVLKVHFAEVTLTHVTIVTSALDFTRGSAIHRTSGVINLRNSIVVSLSEMRACTGGLTQASGNLSNDGSCSLLERRIDPAIGELTGAPGWFPLLDGSPALNTAEPDYCLETDQLGTARPDRGDCDVGAIESTTAALPIAPVVPPPGCPLHDAIIAANTDAPAGACLAGSGHDTIALDADVTLHKPLPPITSTITIDGNGYTISGDEQYPIFDIAGANVTIRNVTLTKSNGVNGGALRLRENARVTVEQVHFLENIAAKGGAVATMSASARVMISDSRFEKNRAEDWGGAVQAERGTVTISNSSFQHNSAGYWGGALSAEFGSLVVTNSTFHRNSASLGGAVATGFGSATLTHVTMVDN